MPGHECADCRSPIPEDVHPYTMRIELFPRVEESLEFSKADFEVDFDEEIRKIVEKLEAMGEHEARIEEERVYSAFSFVLCPACRDRLAARLRRNMTAP